MKTKTFKREKTNMPQNLKGQCGWICVFVLYFDSSIWFTPINISTIKADSKAPGGGGGGALP